MKHTIIDFETMIESVRKDGRRHDYPIDEIEIYEDYLHYKRPYVGHPHHRFLEYYLFPRENMGIYKFYQGEDTDYDPALTYHYYVDMLSVNQEQASWTTKDLYIDFIIKKDGKYYVVDIDEFNAAIERNELECIDVANALNGLDSVLKGYYSSFSMETLINTLKSKYEKPEKLLMKKHK